MENLSMLNLADLFTNKFYRIPDYQRGYAWGERQLTELWDDINDLSDDEQKLHYTGAIYVEKIHDQKSSSKHFYSVIDGQQRLTAISILLFELLKIEEKSYLDEPIENLRSIYIAHQGIEKKLTYHLDYLGQHSNFLLRLCHNKWLIFDEK